MWTCNFNECTQQAVRGQGECQICNLHLCSTHLKIPFHGCPKWQDGETYDQAMRDAEEREIARLIERINTDALATRACALRNGMRCFIQPLRYDKNTRSSVMGGMNYHVDISFENGTVWIARIRRFNASSPPRELQDYIIRSEVATLRFLERTAVPVPRVFDFDVENKNNPVGVGFILMERIPGKSLRWSLAGSEQRRRVMHQLARIFIELHQHPLAQIGSLHNPDSADVGPFARESLTDFTPSGMRALGPFSSLMDYHTASLELILDLIMRDELYALQPVDAYLIHKSLLDLVPRILPQEIDDQGRFFLKHADDKGDHILVDKDFNITAIIDWEWAHAMPPAIAFNSPIGLLPVEDFYDGSNDLGEDEIVFIHLLEEAGRSDLSRFVRQGRLQHRFMFCCGYDLEDWEGFLGLFKGLRQAVGVDESLDWTAWKKVALDRYKDDKRLQRLLLRESESHKLDVEQKWVGTD